MVRKYEQKKRAESTAETRGKIVRAAVELHRTLGPAQTSVSAIAEKAGVRRATVYEHFPDERSIFDACTAHFFNDHPPPDHHRWTTIHDPLERLTQGLSETYAYYRRAEPMLALAYRDAQLKPVMWEVEAVQAQARHWQQAFDVLLAPWAASGPPQPLLVAALRHALDFQTWHTLARRQGLTDPQAVELMSRLVHCQARNDRPGVGGG